MMKNILSCLLALIVLLQLNTSFGQGSGEKFRLLTYGMPNFAKQNAKNVISEQWGIEYYAVAGCMVTQELMDSVAIHNNTVEPLIKEKYGKDWNEQFWKEVEAEYATEQKVIALLDKADFIIKKEAELNKEGNGLDYTMSPVKNSTQYNVSVSGWGKLNGQSEWVSYYRLLVDYNRKTVKLLSDKMIKE